MPRSHEIALNAVDFLPPEAESQTFLRLRTRMLRTVTRQTLEQARFRLGLVLLLSGVLWGALFWLFADGFAFLEAAIPHPQTHDQTVRAMFSLFFGALLVMLVFSAGVLLYGSLFHSREVAFLLTTPARTERVFLHKFQEVVLLSSWGFLLLGSPMLLAYGVVSDAPWYFYAMLGPFLAAFVYVPAAIGAMACLVLIRAVPRRRGMATVVLAGCVFGVAGYFGWRTVVGPGSDLLTPAWFQGLLDRMRIAENRLSPSWWLSSGLLEAARGTWSESVLFLCLLFANALFLRLLAVWVASRLYRPAYSALAGNAHRPRQARPQLVDQLAACGLWFLPRSMRLLMVKDWRLFRRDPLQWSQLLVFLGLLVLYFLNVRRFHYDVFYVGWVNMVSFLNLAVVGLLMSTFTTRFVFPLVSLEAQRFWLLGLTGVQRQTILWSKFAFATLGSLAPCAGLVFLSDWMLDVKPLVLLSHQVTCITLCLGLSGIAVGLGARLPQLRETSPARIAAGFGGTLSLVLSTLFILVLVLLTALPIHFYLVATAPGQFPPIVRTPDALVWLRNWVVAGIAGNVLLGAAATAIPLWLGMREFRRREFC